MWAYLGGGTNPINVSIDDFEGVVVGDTKCPAHSSIHNARWTVLMSLLMPVGRLIPMARFLATRGISVTGRRARVNRPTSSTRAQVRMPSSSQSQMMKAAKASVSHDVTVVAPNVLPTAAFTDSVTDLAATLMLVGRLILMARFLVGVGFR